MTIRTTKRNHYVPVFWLNQFTDANGKLWVYDKNDRKWFDTATNPINAGVETGMYPQELEDWFRDEVESPASPIFEKLSTQDGNLSESEMLVIANFISRQIMRVPATRDMVKAYDTPGSHELRDLFMREIKKFRSKYGEEVYEKEIQPLESLLDTDPQSFLNKVGWRSTFPEMLKAPMHDDFGQGEASFLMSLAWRIIYADKGRYVLSDKPVSVIGGYRNPTFECVLPISTNCAIHIGRYGHAGIVNEVLTEDRLVKQLNTRIVADAQRFIYSTRKERWVEKSVNARTRLSCRPHIQFDGPLIQAQYDRPSCPNCGGEYTQAEWDSSKISYETMEEDGKYILNEVRDIEHSCSMRTN